MDALALASEEARHVHEGTFNGSAAGIAERSGVPSRQRSRGVAPVGGDPPAKRQRSVSSDQSEQLALALEWLKGTGSSPNALRQSLPPAYAMVLIRDESFNPGPRPLHFDPAKLQKLRQPWVFKEWSGQHNRRTGANDSAAQHVDRWHNSGGSKNSRDLPTNVDRPLVKRRYGAIEQHAGTQNGTSVHRGYSYHEYVALERTSDGNFQEDRTVVLYHVMPKREREPGRISAAAAASATAVHSAGAPRLPASTSLDGADDAKTISPAVTEPSPGTRKRSSPSTNSGLSRRGTGSQSGWATRGDKAVVSGFGPVGTNPSGMVIAADRNRGDLEQQVELLRSNVQTMVDSFGVLVSSTAHLAVEVQRLVRSPNAAERNPQGASSPEAAAQSEKTPSGAALGRTLDSTLAQLNSLSSKIQSTQQQQQQQQQQQLRDAVT